VIIYLIVASEFIMLLACRCNRYTQNKISGNNSTPKIEITLPDPVFKSNTSVEEALLKRRSVRRYKDDPLEIKEISQLLWAAQGITSESGGARTAPSAGALYPLELYLVGGNINNLSPGIYLYHPLGHTLSLVAAGDMRESLTSAAHLQGSVNRSAAVIVIAAVYRRTTRKYGARGIRYVQLEAGHAAQNICLQAVSLQIGTVTIGSFTDSLVKKICNLPEDQEPLYLMPIGKKKD
jgi:SagB-type dehydrogenase family enzyme